MRKSKGSTLTSDASREWEIRSIVGQKIVDHEVYYRVNWEPTWMPESALDRARPLIDKFLTQLCEPLDGWNKYREGGSSKRGWQENMESGVLKNAEPKRRGRPRKR